jgi:hypothetical protein
VQARLVLRVAVVVPTMALLHVAALWAAKADPGEPELAGQSAPTKSAAV